MTRSAPTWSLVLFLALAACDLFGDGGAGDPTGPDGGAADGGTVDGGTADGGTADGGTAVQESDCTDGVDNDGDGLADCEDGDCADACWEDCADGADNDADGRIDCDDDECFGHGSCGWPYAMTLVADIELVGSGFGVYYLELAGYPAVGLIRGEATLTIEPSGWQGPSKTCTGAVLGTNQDAYGGMTYGSWGTGDHPFEVSWAPTVANHGLDWDGDCPITALPPTELAMPWGSNSVLRRDGGGAWPVQYIQEDEALIEAGTYGEKASWSFLWYPTQVAPVTWTGTYDF